jgi:hypothetical protein
MDGMDPWYSGMLVSFAGCVMVWFYIFKPSKKLTPVYTIETYTPLYTMKYKNVFQEMERIPMDDVRLHALECLFIKEVTEKGDTVIMCYSHDLEAFHYWCDNRNISFIELDTIAQLYTIVNQCKTVYKETEPTVVKKNTRTMSKSQMVSFKHYNRPNPKMHDMYLKYNRFTRQGCIQEWMTTNVCGEWSVNHGVDPDYKVLIWVASKLDVSQPSNETLSYKDWVSEMRMETQ